MKENFSAALPRGLATESDGDPGSPPLYETLRSIARKYMSRERPNHTLQPTALVNEAYLRLESADPIEWQGRTHFLATAATQMRRILVEHARAAQAKKRGGRQRRITLDDHLAFTPDRTLDVLAIDQALTRLHESSPRQGRVAELRLFSGMKVAEVAETLEVSERTVKGDWRVARAWLARELGGAPP